MIKFVAICHEDRVYIGGHKQRHSHLIHSMVKEGLDDQIKGTQGFVDDTGTFLNRADAAKHAWACGQLPNDKTCPEAIISEDLW